MTTDRTDLTEESVRAALAEVLTPRSARTRTSVMGAGTDDIGAARRYLAATRPGGWAVPEWPVEHGGRGAARAEAALIARVRREFEVPDLYGFMVSLYLAAPTLQKHATREQQDRWLPPIAAGEDVWCQLFSEPEAGSDLANLACRATREGDAWILQGQKVWTSRASYADWGLCIARTDPDVPKHKGLTVFAVRMHAPGLDVRPMRQMNGDTHFSEVFLDGVRVPDADRIDAVGNGWAVTLTCLAHERGAGSQQAGPSGRSAAPVLPGWLRELRDAGVLADPVLRSRAAEVYALERVARTTRMRAAANARAKAPGPEGSILKLLGGKVFRARAELGLDALGAAGLLAGTPQATEFLTAPSMSIRGGTDEIQRNVVAERVLGLPAEPRGDRDVPWARSRRGDLT